MKNLINIIEKLKVNSQTKIHNKNPEDWNIEKAENGDIICTNGDKVYTKHVYFIYKCLDKDKKTIIYHACCDNMFRLSQLRIGPNTGVGTIDNNDLFKYKLASDDQCQKLFDLLKKKGYEWDETKLELVKI